MKFTVIVLVCLAVAAQAQFGGFQGRGQQAYGSQPFKQVYKPLRKVTVSPSPVRSAYPKQSANDLPLDVLKYGNEINADGSYAYFYETNNGIAAQEQGTPRNFGGNPPVIPDVAQGSFSWTSPEGIPIAISYIADENGYQPQGDAIPTPPPVPPQIARALEYIARNAPRK